MAANNQRNLNDDGDSAETTEKSIEEPEVDQGIILRTHKALTKGLKMSNRDILWQGTVVTNKNVDVMIYVGDQQCKVSLKKNKPMLCDMRVLQQLVIRATQEGSVDKKYDWNATHKQIKKNPLDIEIVAHAAINTYVQAQTPAVPQP